MENKNIQKLIALAFILIFGLGVLLSVRFIKNEISQATTAVSNQKSDNQTLNIDAFGKIKGRF